MSRGIILLAIGDHAYGKFAANMAISIKEYNTDLAVQLICEEKTISHLSEWYRSFFDIISIIEKEDCYIGGKMSPAKAKLSIYKYLFFDENIYLDVDGLCLRDLSSIFESCADGYYYSQVVGRYQVEKEVKPFPEMQWAKPDIMIEHFHLKEGDVIPAINSSFQYIKKTKKSEELFKIANECFDNGLSDKQRWYKWGKDNLQPDELYINIALAKCGVWPEMKIKKVIYFDNHRIIPEKNLLAEFFVLGLYGGIRFTHSSLQDYYDRVMQKICLSKNKNHIYKCHNLMKGKIS